MGIIKKRIGDLDKQLLQPNSQVTDIKNVAPELITDIEKQAVNNFIADFRISNLFQQTEESGLIKFVPVISLIVSIITLIIIIAK